MKVLIAVASKHGSTREIGGAIAEELRSLGLAADLHEAGEVESIAGYDAVILGSAVYLGHWLAEATAFATRQSGPLAVLPVWLFSSGPIGPADRIAPGDLADLQAATGARGHAIFAGKADLSNLGPGERPVAWPVHAPPGDCRDWDDIRTWAHAVGGAIARGQSASVRG